MKVEEWGFVSDDDCNDFKLSVYERDSILVNHYETSYCRSFDGYNSTSNMLELSLHKRMNSHFSGFNLTYESLDGGKKV